MDGEGYFSGSSSLSSHQASYSHRSFLLQLCCSYLCYSELVLYRRIMVLPSQISWMRCSGLGEIKPKQQIYMRELTFRQCKTESSWNDRCFFLWCSICWSRVSYRAFETCSSVVLCNVLFVCGWTSMWADNNNAKLWQKVIRMSFLFLLAFACFYKYWSVEWVPDWWVWKPACQCFKGKAFKNKYP